MSELVALLDGREVGRVRQQKGKLTFTYTDDWRGAPGAYPLSLSMPLALSEHSNSAIEPFIWGLLPDNELVLNRWARQFQVSPRNAFSLISHVGEDCAGAVQFVAPERLEELTTAAPAETEWLSEADVANRLRALQADASAWRAPRDTGQFSLAGAQPKTALLFDGQRWGVPSGRTPTTHILKPPTGGFDGHAENEHLCLRLAQSLGLPVAHSEVRRFENMTAIVVERYDRVNIQKLALSTTAQVAATAAEAAKLAASNDPKSVSKVARLVAEATDLAATAKSLSEFSKTTQVYRVHQEDLCQALRIHPSLKYQNDGGPNPIQIVTLLRANVSSANRSKEIRIPNASEDDVSTFVNALVLNWLIGGTDAHAKNYSLLIGGGGMVRLAPLYDVASIFAYSEIDPRKAKLAMKIGDEYKIQAIGLSDWRKFSESVRVDGDVLIERIRAMAKELPDRLSDEIAIMRKAGLAHDIIGRLGNILSERANAVSKL
jgi:serine/threonine-protein kinase HipA